MTSPAKIKTLKAIRDTHQGNASSTQASRLLAALSRFSVSTFEAMRYLDVYHCPARILNLRQRGHDIATHWQTVTTEAGASHRVGVYTLKGRA